MTSQLTLFGSADESIFLLPAHRARRSRLLASGKDSATQEANLHSDCLTFLTGLGLDGSFGKTSPVFCPAEKDSISPPSSGRWLSGGMGSLGGCLTLSFQESRNDAVESSLSDILETGEVPQRYFLSQKACRGIIRRAAKRGRTLPEPLRLALAEVADSEPISSVTADCDPCTQSRSVP